MEPFSAAAAAVALCPIVIGIAQELRVAYKKITYARQELEELVNEMDIFTDLYTEFLKVCSTRKRHRRSVSSAKRKLVSWTRHAIADFKTLAHKVDALSRDPVYKHSIIDTGLAKFKWYFNTKHLVFLRASLSIARQSMVGFTNICAIELLDEQLTHLKSILTAQQREGILYDYGMTVEQRIQVLQSSRDTYELKQSELPNRLEEAEKKVNDHAKQKNKHDVIKQKRRIIDFSESVERYVERVLPMDDAGNRPPRPPRRSKDGSRSQRHDSSLTSQSTNTTQTQSTQPSYQEPSTPESPPTSPEPTHVDTPSEPQVDEEEVVSTYNFCERCGGTCTKTEAHNNAVKHTPSEVASHTSLVVPPAVSRPPPKPESNKRKLRAASCPESHRTRMSGQSPMSPKIAPHEMDRRCPAEPTIDAGRHAGPRYYMDITRYVDAEDALQDESSQEEGRTDEQARNAKPSIWQATGAFEGSMPRGLSKRRQRSQSPQDFW